MSTKQLALNDCYGNLKLLLESLAGAPAADGSRMVDEPLTHQEVLDAGASAGPRLARVIRRFIRDLDRVA